MVLCNKNINLRVESLHFLVKGLVLTTQLLLALSVSLKLGQLLAQRFFLWVGCNRYLGEL